MDNKKSIIVGFSLGIMAAVLGFGIYFFVQVRTITFQNRQQIGGVIQFLASKYPELNQAPQVQTEVNK